MTPVVDGWLFSDCLMNLHFGKLAHAINFPNFPSRSMSFPFLHCGHASPVSLGGAISLPSIVSAPVHSGNRAQLKNVPERASLITIGPWHLGHRISLGASPILVTLSIFSLLLIALANGV